MRKPMRPVTGYRTNANLPRVVIRLITLFAPLLVQTESHRHGTIILPACLIAGYTKRRKVQPCVTRSGWG